MVGWEGSRGSGVGEIMLVLLTLKGCAVTLCLLLGQGVREPVHEPHLDPQQSVLTDQKSGV